ncbi:MAG: hypothetical protein H6828_11945 [Planctomycetes bacterium]|nr:hypothetical protein [Planctomycetota bacterium]
MKLGKHTCWTLLCGLPLWLAGCSGGGAGVNGGLDSVVQNLTLDPDGTTTVVTFTQAPGTVTAGNFSADGGQSATGVSVSGTSATVTWDARVTPSHQVSVSGVPGIDDGTSGVTTTNGSAPTFTITDSSMGTGLGADTLEVTFSGPRVVEADAEDPASWTLTLGSTAVDLSDSTFDLDPATQVMSVTLGASASLHSSFTLAASALTSVADVALSTSPVAGTASGDSTAPMLLTVNQNLTEDEYGRVVDFQWDEAMDPTFSEVVSNFGVALPNVATSVSQPSAGLLRVSFSQPVIPGVHTIDVSNMMDAHGNTVGTFNQAVFQPTPVANAYDSSDAVTVANQGGDYVVATFDQAFDATSAADDANWALVVDGNPVTMANQTLTYDFAGKSLRIDLDFDMVNGTTWVLTASNVLEVDGETFSQVANGLVGGDATAPTVTSVVQNRVQDPSGQTLDVTFSEDLDGTAVATLGNWTVSGLTVSGANLLGTPDVVRLTVTGGPAVPGTNTLDVASQADLAGNAMGSAQTGIAITSTDTTAPTALSASAVGAEGADNDTVMVFFDDNMVQAEVENTAYWTVESPIGTALTVTGSTISYDDTARRATLTFDAGNGMFFKSGDDFRVTLATMTDISDNALPATSLTGNVSVESNRPYAHWAYKEASATNEVVLYFSEHMDGTDSLFHPTTNEDGTRYELYTSGAALKGSPTGATVLDGGLGVRLVFGFTVDPTDLLTVAYGTDLAGNEMFPASLLPLDVEDANEPGLNLPASPLVAVSGERNDQITVVFDRAINPWGATDPANYDVASGGSSLDLSQATFTFDGDSTVSILLDGATADSVQSGDTYDFTVTGLRTAQGVELSAPATSLGEAVQGDISTGPVVGPGKIFVDRANPDSLLVFANEALDPTLAEDEARWNWNSGNFPTLATLIGPTVVRLTFSTNTSAGTPLAYDVVDLAGNHGGATFDQVLAFESSAPLLTSVSGTAVAGAGGDWISIVFDEPTELSTCLDPANYSVTNGGAPVGITGVGAWYDSTNMSANFFLDAGYELEASSSVTVTVSGVQDFSGNTIVGPVALSGAVTGDTTTPPSVDRAYTNYGFDATGLVVDVLFSEAPEETFVTNQFNWDVTGSSGQVVLGVLPTEDEAIYRVVLSDALGAGEELEIAAGLADLAGNTTVAVTSVTVYE